MGVLDALQGTADKISRMGGVRDELDAVNQAKADVLSRTQEVAPDFIQSLSPEELNDYIDRKGMELALKRFDEQGGSPTEQTFRGTAGFVGPAIAGQGDLPVVGSVLAEPIISAKRAIQDPNSNLNELAGEFGGMLKGERPDLVRMAVPAITTALALSPYTRVASRAVPLVEGGGLLSTPVGQTFARGLAGSAFGGIIAEKLSSDRPPTFEEYLKSATREMFFEAGGQGMSIVPTAIKAGFARFAGVSSGFADTLVEAAARANAAARRAGLTDPIQLTLQDVSPAPLVRGARNMLGRFAITNRPFVKAGERQASGLVRARDRILIGLSPIVESLQDAIGRRDLESQNRIAGRLARTFLDQHRKASDLFKRLSREKYQKVRELADTEGLVVHPASLLSNMEFQLRKLIAESPDFIKISKEPVMEGIEFNPENLMLTLKEGTREQKKVIQKALDPDIIELIGKLDGWMNGSERLSHTQTFSKAGSIAADLGELIAKTEGRRASEVYQILKKAIRNDIKLAVSDSGSEELKRAFTEADEFFTDNWNLFTRSPGGRRVKSLLGDFGQREQRTVSVDNVTPEGFRAVEDGVVSDIAGGTSRFGPEESIRILLKEGTAQEVADIRNMLALTGPEGKKVFRDAVGSYMVNAWTSSVKTLKGSDTIQLFDPKVMRKALGFTDPSSDAFRKTRIMLRGTGVSVRDIDSVLSLTERLFADGVPNLSDMITRRAILGGIRSGLNTLLPGTNFSTFTKNSPTGAISDILSAASMYTAWLITRTAVGGKLLTDPKSLKMLRTLMNDQLGEVARARSLKNLMFLHPAIFSVDEVGNIGDLIGGAANATLNAVQAVPNFVAGLADRLNQQAKQRRTQSVLDVLKTSPQERAGFGAPIPDATISPVQEGANP